MGDERILHGVQDTILGKPLDRPYLAVFVLDRKRQTAVDPFAIHQDGAGTARALIASLLGSGQAQVIAKRIQQRYAGFQQK
jgi:hypothetical protein